MALRDGSDRAFKCPQPGNRASDLGWQDRDAPIAGDPRLVVQRAVLSPHGYELSLENLVALGVIRGAAPFSDQQTLNQVNSLVEGYGDYPIRETCGVDTAEEVLVMGRLVRVLCCRRHRPVSLSAKRH